MWILARELSKSIDSEGVLYNAVGVHKRSETDLTQLEQMWTESQTCLEQHNHHTKLDGTSKAVIIRKSINEMIGFEIAYRTYDKAIDHYLGRKNRNDENWRNTPIKNFFQTSSSVYCLVPQREASIVSEMLFFSISSIFLGAARQIRGQFYQKTQYSWMYTAIYQFI
jgi:hypothetical protein